MQQVKVTGKLDKAGRLTISEPIELSPGEVEVTITQNAVIRPEANTGEIDCEIPQLKAWLENSRPIPENVTPDESKWSYLKEKYSL